jgi:hypothetical protein
LQRIFFFSLFFSTLFCISLSAQYKKLNPYDLQNTTP